MVTKEELNIQLERNIVLRSIANSLKAIVELMQRTEEREIVRGKEASKVAQRILNDNK